MRPHDRKRDTETLEINAAKTSAFYDTQRFAVWATAVDNNFPDRTEPMLYLSKPGPKGSGHMLHEKKAAARLKYPQDLLQHTGWAIH